VQFPSLLKTSIQSLYGCLSGRVDICILDASLPNHAASHHMAFVRPEIVSQQIYLDTQHRVYKNYGWTPSLPLHLHSSIALLQTK